MSFRTSMGRLAMGLVIGAMLFLGGTMRAAEIIAESGETYQTIQAAIDASPTGTQIRIPAGTYRETLRIDKSIVLIGEGADQTEIITSDDVAWDEAGLHRELLAELERDAESSDPKQAFAKVEGRLARVPLTIARADGVQLTGLRFTGKARTSVFAPAIVSIEDSGVTMQDCAIVAAFGDGIHIKGRSTVELQGCLVSAAWHTGVAIQKADSGTPNVRIHDCDIRNNYYSGIVIGRNCDKVVIANCRISGSAWHGVRYDDASPQITGNAIFGNARSGIYASGKTAAQVTNNLFTANEMDAISCWFQNADRIAANTIVANHREGLAILGASSPKIQRNIIAHEKEGIQFRLIGGEAPSGTRFGEPRISQNILWENELHTTKSYSEAGTLKKETPDISEENLIVDPLFVDAESGDYTLSPDSPARERGIGLADPPTLNSKWPLQPEEASIIPETATRDNFQWRNRQQP